MLIVFRSVCKQNLGKGKEMLLKRMKVQMCSKSLVCVVILCIQLSFWLLGLNSNIGFFQKLHSSILH